QGGLAGWAERRGEQRPRLLGHPRSVLHQRQLVDEFPAAGAVLPAVRRPGPALDLAVAIRAGRAARAAFADVLVDPVAVTGREPLARVPHLADALGQVGAGVPGRGGGPD